MIYKWFGISVLLFSVSHISIADVIVSNVDEDGAESEVKLSQSWGKVVDKSEPNQYMLVDMKKNSFYVVDKDEKIVVNLGDLSKMMPMDPHQSGGAHQFDIKIEKVGKGPDIIGYETTHYKLLLNGDVCSEHFISKGPLKHPEIQAFSDSMQTQAKPNMSPGFMESPCDAAENYFDTKVFDYGVPLLSKNADGKEVFKIVKIETGLTLSEDEFALPKDFPVYTQDELMQREMQRSMSSGGQNNHDDAMSFDMPDIDPNDIDMPTGEDMEKLKEQMQQQLQQMQQMMQDKQ